MGLGELLVPMSSQPYASQWALLGKHKVRVEHLKAKILAFLQMCQHSAVQDSANKRLYTIFHYGTILVRTDILQRTYPKYHDLDPSVQTYLSMHRLSVMNFFGSLVADIQVERFYQVKHITSGFSKAPELKFI